MARIDYIDRPDLPEQHRELLDSTHPKENLPKEFEYLMSGNERNFYRTLGHTPEVLAAFKDITGLLWSVGELDAYRHELVTLTVSRVLQSEYEWNQRVRISLNEGFTTEEILAVSRNCLDQFDPADATLIEYTEAFIDGEVDSDLHDSMVAHFDTETIVAVGMLIGLYMTIERIETALELDLEEEFVGWELENV
jgi:alkylhydroperoxidase family enzyme